MRVRQWADSPIQRQSQFELMGKATKNQNDDDENEFVGNKKKMYEYAHGEQEKNKTEWPRAGWISILF